MEWFKILSVKRLSNWLFTEYSLKVALDQQLVTRVKSSQQQDKGCEFLTNRQQSLCLRDTCSQHVSDGSEKMPSSPFGCHRNTSPVLFCLMNPLRNFQCSLGIFLFLSHAKIRKKIKKSRERCFLVNKIRLRL